MIYRKFRGKAHEDGRWVTGDLVHSSFGVGIRYFAEIKGIKRGVTTFVDPDTAGQFTGMYDNTKYDNLTEEEKTEWLLEHTVDEWKGRPIFEGDIVTIPAYNGGKWKSVVYFKNGKFAVDGSNYNFKDIAPKRTTVIGNIHDNPELIGGAE